MAHFIIDCSEQVIKLKSQKNIIQRVSDTAKSSGLFASEEIKIKVNPFRNYNVSNANSDFIHVFANYKQTRNKKHSVDLPKKIFTELKEIFPEVPIISIYVRANDNSIYYNKTVI